MLLTVEAVAKILFRFGVDTAFMRLYYDCADQQARQKLASTIFFFLLAINGAVLLAAVAASGWLSVRLFETDRYWLLVALGLANTFVGGFYFIPAPGAADYRPLGSVHCAGLRAVRRHARSCGSSW